MKMFTVQCEALKPSGAKIFGGASSEALELGGRCAEILFSRRPPSLLLDLDNWIIFKTHTINICLRVNVGALIACENGIYVVEAIRMGYTLCAVRGPGVPHYSSWYVQPL